MSKLIPCTTSISVRVILSSLIAGSLWDMAVTVIEANSSEWA